MLSMPWLGSMIDGPHYMSYIWEGWRAAPISCVAITPAVWVGVETTKPTL